YHSTDKDWLSNSTNDIGSDGRLGTDGFIFFGDFVETGTPLQINPGNEDPGLDGNENIIGANAGTQTSDSGGPQFTVLAPVYVTTASTGANSGNVGQFGTYEAIDSPVALNGDDALAGNLLVTGNGANALSFVVDGLAASTTVRVGVLGAVLNDGPDPNTGADRARFDAPTISLSDGTTTASVTGLANLSGSADPPSLGWVFFDIDSDGTYTVGVPPDAAGPNPDVTGFGGITFDSIVTPVPEPSTSLLAGLAGLALAIRRRR
ncbi:PEP-CTERM sorting domain-containing protein, partial [bacterium]|nr:PEP-CTERM sorting domain-containing protein [bacterium]